MLTLRIRHRTTYLYHAAVRLSPHRLMLRPRESRELRLVSQELTVSPPSSVTGAHDVFGNAVATANFDGGSDRLVIEREAVLSLSVEPWPVFGIAAVATGYPFACRLEGPRRAGSAAVSGSRASVACMGERLRAQRANRHAVAAEGSQLWRGRADPLRSPGKRGAPRRHPKLLRVESAHVGTSQCCS